MIIRDHVARVIEAAAPLEFYFTYSSTPSSLSARWHFSQDKRLISAPSAQAPVGSTVTLMERDAYQTVLTMAADKNYYAPARSSGTSYLYFDGSVWIYNNFHDNCFEYYDAAGLLRKHQDIRGAQTIYEYDTQNRLNKITGPSSTTYEIRRQDTTIAVFMVSPGAETCLVTYTFDANGSLLTTQLPSNYKVTYAYDTKTNALSSLAQTDGTNIAFSFTSIASNATALQNINLGPCSFAIDYSQLAASNTVNYTLGSSMKRSIVLNSGRIAKLSKQQGYFQKDFTSYDVTSYGYNSSGQIASITLPDMSQEKFSYDHPLFFITAHTKPDGSLINYVYQAASKKPRVVIKNEYDAQGAALSTRYVYDTQESADLSQYYSVLRFKITPKGSVTECRVDPVRHLVSSERTYLLSAYPVASLAPTAPIALAYMMQWAQSQDASQVALTDFLSYDARGQLSSQQNYAVVTAAGQGVVDAHISVLANTWNAFGDCLTHAELQVFGQGLVTTLQSYDDLRRVLTSTDALSQETAYVYQDAQRQTQITRPNTRIELNTYDTLGVISDHQETATTLVKDSKYYPDSVGRVSVLQDPDGIISYRLYDQQQRLVFEISALGILTQHDYNRQVRFKKTTQYFKSITQGQLFPPPAGKSSPAAIPLASSIVIALPAISSPQQDVATYAFFDACDRIRYKVDAENYVQELQYDTRGHVVATISYSTDLTAAQLTALTQGATFPLIPDATKDQINNFFYDADGLRVGQQDPMGYVTEYCFDVAGRMTQEIRYATPTALSTTLAAARPALDPLNDAHHYYFYDGKNKVIMEVDAEGYITTIDHTPNGLVRAKYSYYTPVDPSWYKNTQVFPTFPAVSPEDRQIINTYDVLNRLTDSVSLAQKSLHQQYDVMGNIVFSRYYDSHYDPKDPKNNVDADKTRDKQARYDGFDQVSAEANPFIAQQLAIIDSSGTLTPAQKQQQEEALWTNNSLRTVYNASGLKLKSINTLGQFTVYYYDLDRRLILSIDPEGAVLENTYNTFNKITQTREYLTVIAPTKLTGLSGGYLTADVSALLVPTDQDPIHQFGYNARLQRITSKDPEGYVTQVVYDAFGQVTQEQLPLNVQTPSLTVSHVYNVRGNEITTTKKSSDKSITVQREYHNLYGKTTKKTDALGNSITYLYTLKGNQKSIMDPDNIVQHTYTYDAFSRVLSDTNAFGDVTRYQYDQNRQMITVILPEANTQRVIQQNIFGEVVVKTNALGQAQAYAHAPNGKVIQFIDALSRVTVDTLNTEGLLTLHQDPLGVQTEFTYNGAHYLITKIEDFLGRKLTTSILVDALGRQLTITNANGIVNKSSYDKRGWCVELVEDNAGLQLMTQTVFNAQGTKTSVSQSDMSVINQYLVLFQQDSLGRTVQKIVDPNTPKYTAGLQLTQANHLDDNDRVVVHVDPKGQLIRLFYDGCGNERFKLEPTGALTEWVYDKNVRISVLKRYITPLTTLTDASVLKDVVSWVAANASVRDTATYFFYDHNGRERFTVTYVDVLGSLTAQGVVTETRYDGDSCDVKPRIIERVGYAKSIAIAQCINTSYDAFLALMATQVDAAYDRHTYYVLDAQGQQRFLFDPEQYAVEQVFDVRGRIIQRIEYATFIPNVQDLIKLSPDQIKLPIDAVDDRITYHVFDVLDKPMYVVNPDEAVTYFQHDNMGNLLLRCRFAKTIVVPSAYQDLVRLVSSLTPDATQGDRITQYKVNGLNRTEKIIDAMGQVEELDHDILGNLVQTIDRAQAATQMKYDRAKRLTLKTSPVSIITTVSRDIQGNLTASQIARSVEEAFAYDPNNNVTQVLKDVNQPGVRTVNNVYSPDNHLSASTFLGIPVDDVTKPADLVNIPVITKDLSVTSVYNTMGLEIVKQDKSWWLWSFKIYDTRGLLLYSINPKGAVIGYNRNVFGELASQISYANVLTIDLSAFAATGLSLEIIAKSLVPDPANDRTATYTRDRRGDVIIISRDPVFYYYPNATGKAEFGFSAPTVTYAKNAFRETYFLRYNRFPAHPELDYTKFCFRGRLGQDLAEVESLQTALTADTLHETPMQYKVARRTFNAFNEEISITEFANPLAKVSPSITLAEIDQACVSSPLDRKKIHSYDLLGQLVEKARVGVVRQQVSVDTQSKPQMQDTAALTLSKKYTHTPTGLRSSKTNEAGHVSYDYHDARGFKIATAGIVNPQGYAVLQSYGIDAHGQQVLTTYYFNGTHLPVLNMLPAPKQADSANDQTNLYLFDQRGLIQIRQRPEGMQLFYTYTPSRDVAREYGPLTTWVVNPTAGLPPLQATVIDETQTVFDETHCPISKITLRNGVVNPNFTTRIQYNAFGETIAQGDGTQFPVFNRYDQVGHCWADNQEEGAARVRLFDLQENPTAILRIPDRTLVDILKLTPADLPSLVNSTYTDTQVEMTSLWVDPNNKVLKTTFPPFAVTPADAPVPIDLSFQVSGLYPELGRISIAWPTFSSSYSLIFSIQQVDQDTPVVLTLQSHNGMTGVDVSSFISDEYQYALSFNSQDPHTKINKTVYIATGVLAIDSGLYAGSKRLVATVKEGHVLYLVGNIAGITTIQLYQDNTLINEFTPTAVPAQSALTFDFKDVKDQSGRPVLSGIYHIKGVRQGMIDAHPSLINVSMKPRSLREVIGNVRIITASVVELMIQYLFYILRGHTTPAAIRARDIRQELNDDLQEASNTRSFKLLRLVVQSPLVQAVSLEQDIRGQEESVLQHIRLLFQEEPFLHIRKSKKDSDFCSSESAREDNPLNRAMGGHLIPDRNKLRRWWSDVYSGLSDYFESADDDLLSTFVLLHALVEKMAQFSLMCRDLEKLVDFVGSKTWVERGGSILLDFQEGYRRLCNEIQLDMQKVHAIAEEHYRQLTSQGVTQDLWLQNYSIADRLKSILFQELDFATRQLHKIPRLIATLKTVSAEEPHIERNLRNIVGALGQFSRFFRVAPFAETDFRDTDDISYFSTISLPFTLFTDYPAPAEQPLSREISFEAQLLILDQKGQLKIWDSLPLDYQSCSILMECAYEMAGGSPVLQQFTISPTTDLGHYTDGDGHLLVCNMEFERSVVKILRMFLVLVLSPADKIVLYPFEAPITPSSDDSNVVLDYQALNRLLLSIENDNIVTYAFKPKTYAYIVPIPGYAQQSAVVLTYQDITQGPNPKQKTLTSQFNTTAGLVFDVTALPPANYPYTIGAGASLIKGLLCVTDGATEFSSDPAGAPMPTVEQTQNRFAYDVFGNTLSETDAYQQTTQNAYNDLNKKVQVTYPPVTVVDETGVAHPNVATYKKMGFDIQGRPVGIINENGHVTIEILDERGNVLQKILGDGTVSESDTYDLFNRQLTVTQPNGTQWTLVRDRCNRLLSQTSSLGVMTVYYYDQKDHRSCQVESGYQIEPLRKTSFGYDEKVNIAIQIEPLGNFSVTTFDRNSEPLSRQDSNGGVIAYVRDYFGKVLTERLMNGATLMYAYDQKEQLVSKQSSNSPAHKNILFQNAHIDVCVDNEDPDNLLWERVDGYAINYIAVPEQNIQFVYSGGLLTKIIDIALNKMSVYGFNLNRKRIACSITLDDGSIRTMTMTLDARGRPQFVQDTNAQIYVSYDAVGNRRRVVSTFIPYPQSPTSLDGDLWSTFDAANRVLIDEGFLALVTEGPVAKGVIQIAPGIGKQFTYKDGLRATEASITSDGKNIMNSLSYDDDGRLLMTVGTVGADKTSTSRTYFPGSNDLQRYDESAPTYSTTRNYRLDDNGNQVYSEALRNDQGGKLEQSAAISYDHADNAIAESLGFQGSQDWLSADLKIDYYCTDSYKEQKVGGTTQGPGGPKGVTPANMYFDSNGYAAGKENTDNGDARTQYSSEAIAFSAAAEGWILGGMRYIKVDYWGYNPDDPDDPYRDDLQTLYQFNIKESLFVDPEGNLFASYLTVQDPANVNRAAMNVHSRNVPSSAGGRQAVSPLGPQAGEFLIADPVQSMLDAPVPCTVQDYQAMTHDTDASNFNRYIPNPMSSFPGITPSKYTVPDDNMSFVAVSIAVAGSPDFAQVIARANGQSVGDLCAAGRVLTIPSLQINCNNVADNANLQQVISVLIGSLSPHLEFAPKPVKSSCMETLFEAVISVMAIVIAPVCAPAAMMAENAALAIGVTAGVLDAGMQELAKGVGLIKHFSWGDVLGAGISAGMMRMARVTSAMNDLYPKAGTAVDFEKQMEAIRHLAIYYGLSNVSEQLVLIAMNKQKGFDIRQVFASMAETAMDNWVGVAMHAPVPALSQAHLTTPEILTRVSLDLVETVVGDAIMGCPPDMEMFMANELGTYAGGKMANPLADYINARPKVPTRSSQQIRQDSLAPHSADYLMASAAAKGQGFSPDYLGAYPGYDDPDDLLNYLLNIQNTSNQPAVQTKTQSQLKVQAQRQASKAAQNSQGFWSSSARRAESMWDSAVNDVESAWSGVTRRADAFVDAHPRVASVVRTMDEIQGTIGLAMAVGSTVMNPKPVPVIDLSQRYPTASKVMMVGAAAAVAFFPEIGARSLIADEGMSLLEENLAVRLSSNRSAVFSGVRGSENAVNTGELNFLKNAKLLSESDLYNPGVLSDRTANNFIGSRYKTYQLTDDFPMYRAGTSSRPLGQYLSFEKPIGELQARIDKAILPVWPDGSVSPIDTGFVFRAPKGTIVHVGDIANQGGIFLGGTKQVVIEKYLLNNLELLNSYPLQEENLWLNTRLEK